MADARAYLGCPCCGYMVIADTYDICPICFWEYDPVQSEFPDIKGANHVTLRQAQRNFLRYGASDDASVGRVRPPNANEARDPDWRLLGNAEG